MTKRMKSVRQEYSSEYLARVAGNFVHEHFDSWKKSVRQESNLDKIGLQPIPVPLWHVRTLFHVFHDF